jgi:hypothetical protein
MPFIAGRFHIEAMADLEMTDSADDAPMMRVFPGATAESEGMIAAPQLEEPRGEVDARAARRCSVASRAAGRYGVLLPVRETHDSNPTGADITADRLEGGGLRGGRVGS